MFDPATAEPPRSVAPAPRPPLTMTPLEVERLLPLAIQDLLEASRCPTPYPPNPVKKAEFLAGHRRRAEARLSRVCDLYMARLEFELELAGA